jgi:hypothetical protein
MASQKRQQLLTFGISYYRTGTRIQVQIEPDLNKTDSGHGNYATLCVIYNNIDKRAHAGQPK